MISIVIPCYNDHAGLALCLASMKMQTFQEYEVIVVDDGSVKPLKYIVDALNDSRFRCIRLQTNSGRGYARVVGLNNAIGDYICLQDADDWSLPRRLERQYEHLKANPFCDLVGCGAIVVGENEEVVGMRGMGNYVAKGDGGITALKIIHASILAKREFFEKNSYDCSFTTAEDYPFLVKALRNCYYTNLDELHYVYREIQSQSLSKRAASFRAEMCAIKSFVWLGFLQKLKLRLCAVLRMGGYVMISLVGLQSWMVKRRSLPIGKTDEMYYMQERERLKEYERTVSLQ